MTDIPSFVGKLLGYARDYAQSAFSKPGGAPKWAALGGTGAAAALGGLLGMVMGGGGGAVIGAILGLIGGGAVSALLGKGGSLFGSRSAVKSRRIDPKPLDIEHEQQVVLAGGGRAVLPKLSGLKKPWKDRDAYLDKIAEDMLNIARDPVRVQAARDALERGMLKENQACYDYLATVEKYCGQDVPGLPKPDFTLPVRLGEEAKVNLHIADGEWERLSAVTQLARAEQSVDQHIIGLAEQWAKLRARGEALGREKNDFTLRESMQDTAKEWIPFTDSRNEAIAKRTKRATEATRQFLEKNGNEKTFRDEMEKIALEESEISPNRATFIRDQAALIVERRRVYQQKNEVLKIKKHWAAQADAWTEAVAKLAPEESRDTGLGLVADAALGQFVSPKTPAGGPAPSPGKHAPPGAGIGT